jgi:hypothetical protein
MAELLARFGVMTELDSGALARYAVVWVRWVDAEDAAMIKIENGHQPYTMRRSMQHWCAPE